MTQKTYIAISIAYLVAMALLIFVGGVITSWLDLFTGFVIGWTVHALLILNRDRNKKNSSRRR